MKTAENLYILSSLFQVVFCRSFSVSLPQTVETVKGLCVLIPCTFDIEDQFDRDLTGSPTGKWFKVSFRDNKFIFDSSATSGSLSQGKLLGDLLQKNCTSILYNISEDGHYSFRLETSGPLKNNFKTPVSITVRDSPPKPSITLYNQQQGATVGQNEVVQGSSVSLTCSTPDPCPSNPPTLIWSPLLKEEHQKNESFISSQLNFRASHLHHGVTFTCTTTYHLQNINQSAQSSVTLRVLYAPQNTSVSASPSSPVLLGSSVSLSCSSDANPKVLNYTWYRENGELIGTGTSLTINRTDHSDRGLYCCRAQNQYGDQNSTLFLDLQYAPRISFSSSCNLTEDSIQCFCQVDGNPAPKLDWFWSGSVNPSSEVLHSVNESSTIFISIPLLSKDSSTLHCVATNKVGMASQFFYIKNLHPVPGSWFSVPSSLIGGAVGAAVMMMLCGVIVCTRTSESPTKEEEEAPGLVLNDMEEDSLHYSSIRHEIRGLCILTEEYTTVRTSTTEEEVPEVMKEEQAGTINRQDEVESVEEEVTYGNIVKPQKMEQPQLEFYIVPEPGKVPNNNQEPDELYAQVKPHKKKKK